MDGMCTKRIIKLPICVIATVISNDSAIPVYLRGAAMLASVRNKSWKFWQHSPLGKAKSSAGQY